ncbi:MAG: ABC transporter substrate-binding protein, partial [Deltaproteobacteria bacterium]|nr:ABC transporter substrate-binding protein [Deltaproteobacteria bacterium]
MANFKFQILVLTALLGFFTPTSVMALEETLISYAGPSITFLPAEVARQRGFFREQNLDAKLLLTRTEVDRAALASGGIHYTLRAGSTFVSAARGLPVRIVFLGTTKPFWALVVRPEIKSINELKGKSMAVPGLLGSQQISAKFILKQHGLDADRDVVYRIVDTGTRIGAMLSGSVDSAMMDYGEAYRARKAGLKFMLNAADYHGLLAGGLGVNSAKLREQPEQVRRVITALLRALRYLRESPEGTQQV